jgi:hypothetical protein
VHARRKQESHRHWVEHSDKGQGKQPHGSLEIRSRHAKQLGKISHRTNVGFSATAIGIRLGFLDLQTS